MQFRYLSLCVLLSGVALCGFAAAPKEEPTNLSKAKAAVLEYCDSGDYLKDVAKVAEKAGTWIEERVKKNQGKQRLAVVMDIDETVLSNLELMKKMDFGYVPSEWDAWLRKAEIPALEPMRDLFLKIRKLGVAVIFVTARKNPAFRECTEENLRREGMGDFESLMMIEEGAPPQLNGDAKTSIREHLSQEGYLIIANIGDQESDLKGGFAEMTFKLPCPFYLTF